MTLAAPADPTTLRKVRRSIRHLHAAGTSTILALIQTVNRGPLPIRRLSAARKPSQRLFTDCDSVQRSRCAHRRTNLPCRRSLAPFAAASLFFGGSQHALVALPAGHTLVIEILQKGDGLLTRHAE